MALYDSTDEMLTIFRFLVFDGLRKVGPHSSPDQHRLLTGWSNSCGRLKISAVTHTGHRTRVKNAEKAVFGAGYMKNSCDVLRFIVAHDTHKSSVLLFVISLLLLLLCTIRVQLYYSVERQRNI